MTSEAAAYLVMRRDDGFGDVFTLSRAQRFTVGRANTNRIVLEDDLCSREHAEVYCGSDGRWVYPLTPRTMAGRLPELLEAGAGLIGGCCGTTPEHIAAMQQILARGANDATDYFQIPTGRVVEIGTQVAV